MECCHKGHDVVLHPAYMAVKCDCGSNPQVPVLFKAAPLLITLSLSQCDAIPPAEKQRLLRAEASSKSGVVAYSSSETGAAAPSAGGSRPAEAKQQLPQPSYGDVLKDNRHMHPLTYRQRNNHRCNICNDYGITFCECHRSV